jgi:hypothetical protein
MVIERFRDGDPVPVRDRFLEQGGCCRTASPSRELDRQANSRCFQVMEAADDAALRPWIARWSDFIDFEVIPVDPAEYWARTGIAAVTPEDSA